MELILRIIRIIIRCFYLVKTLTLGVAPINPIRCGNPSISGSCRIASPTCERPFKSSLPWSVRLSSAARRCIWRTLLCANNWLACTGNRPDPPSARPTACFGWCCPACGFWGQYIVFPARNYILSLDFRGHHTHINS